MVKLAEAAAALEPVTVTEYKPAPSPVIDCVVPLLLQLYVYGGVPPTAVAVNAPLEPPLHETEVV